jgi:coenzyme PQQ precursor peptide PqqA
LPTKLDNRARQGPVFFAWHPTHVPRLRGHKTALKFGRTSVWQGANMAWTTPVLVEICVGLEINGYLPAEY